jgi:hypothetical protein
MCRIAEQQFTRRTCSLFRLTARFCQAREACFLKGGTRPLG